MSVSEQALNWVQALIWPALIVVGVWVFRKELRALIARIKSVEAGGAKVEMEPVAEVLRENLQETREELAKADDPEERRRTVDKLQREAAALGRVEAVQESPSHRTGSELLDDPAIVHYLNDVYSLALERAVEEGVPRNERRDFATGARSFALGAVAWRTTRGNTVDRAIDRVGTPEQVVDAFWFVRPPSAADRRRKEGTLPDDGANQPLP
jgi:hypothetical protein